MSLFRDAVPENQSQGVAMIRFSIAVFALALVLSCGGEEREQASQAEDSSYLVGLAISMREDTPFFSSLTAGAVESADARGIQLIIVYADEDPVLQSAQIMELAEQGIDLLLLNPVSDSVDTAVDLISEMGIPVLTIDRGLNCECIVCHIASDNRSGGVMAGEYLAEAMHRTGNVVEIQGTEGSSAAAERGAGFQEAMAAYPDIRIVASFHAGFSREQAEAEFSRVLSETDSIQGVFAHNDDMILGAISAAKSAGYHDILFVGFDAIDEAVLAVENGELMATIAQRPAEMGYLGVETALEVLTGNEVPYSITIDLALILR